jgi:hypothetical protein
MGNRYTNLNPIVIIDGSEQWNSFKGKTIINKTIHITNMGDLHPYVDGVSFPNTVTIFLTHCDKNFVYYWLNKTTFPNVKTIYLRCHPCEHDVLHRFPESNIYLSDYYSIYKDRWAPENNNVELTTSEIITGELSKFEKEDIMSI